MLARGDWVISVLPPKGGSYGTHNQRYGTHNQRYGTHNQRYGIHNQSYETHNRGTVASAFRRKGLKQHRRRHAPCSSIGMPHPYPRHRSNLPYTGKHYYFLTFCTDQRRQVFNAADAVHLAHAQFLRAADAYRFQITAYCFMPDHVHLAIHGTVDHADCKAFIKAAKQYSGYAFKQRHDQRLWQRYGFERVIRDDLELASTIRYIISNPVRAALATHPSEFPHLGSQIYSVEELLEICGYRAASADLPPEGGSHHVQIVKSSA
jgi:putative transposase